MAEHSPVRARFKQDLNQVRTPVGRRLVERRVTSGLRHVDIRSLLDQQAHGFAILAYGNAGMERLVVQGIPRKAVYMGSMGQQQNGCLGSAERGRQMQRSPAVARVLMNQHGILPQQRFNAGAIAQGASLKNIQGVQAGKQEIPDQRLAVINAPQKSRDALGVSASNQRRIFFCGGGNFRRLAVLYQIKKTLAHRASLASVRDYLAIGLADRSSQHRLL